MKKKLKQWLATKPKWLQWSLGTNLGRIAICGALCLVFIILAETISSDTLNPIFNKCSLVFAGIISLHILFFFVNGVINEIKGK